MPDNHKAIQFAQDLTGLTEKRGSDCGDGFLCWVNTQQIHYVCRKTTPPALLPADGVNVVASLDGACVWVRLGTDQSYGLVADIYIDPVSGSDDETGLSETTALRSLRRYLEIMDGVRVSVIQTVHLAAGTYEEGFLYAKFLLDYGGHVKFEGVAEEVATSVVSSSQDWDQPTWQEGWIVATGIEAYENNALIEWDSGQNKAWICKKLDTDKMRLSVPQSEIDNVPIPAPSTVVTIKQIQTVIHGGITIEAISLSSDLTLDYPFGGPGAIEFEHVEINPVLTEKVRVIGVFAGPVLTRWCRFGRDWNQSTGTGGERSLLTLQNCFVHGYVLAQDFSAVRLNGGVFFETVHMQALGQAGLEVGWRTISQGRIAIDVYGGRMEFPYEDYWLCELDNNKWGIRALGFGVADLRNAVFWGLYCTDDGGNPNAMIVLEDDGTVLYTTGKLPNVDGFTYDFTVDGTPKSFSTDLPFIDTTNEMRMYAR